MRPFRKATFVTPAFALFSCASASISSVMSTPIDETRWPNALRREQHIDAATGAKVEHRLTFVQIDERGWIAAAQRRQDRLLREACDLVGGVEVIADRITAAAAVPATTATAALHLLGGVA